MQGQGRVPLSQPSYSCAVPERHARAVILAATVLIKGRIQAWLPACNTFHSVSRQPNPGFCVASKALAFPPLRTGRRHRDERRQGPVTRPTLRATSTHMHVAELCGDVRAGRSPLHTHAQVGHSKGLRVHSRSSRPLNTGISPTLHFLALGR